MGHYGAEMQIGKTPKEEKKLLREQRLDEHIRRIKLDVFTVRDLYDLLAFIGAERSAPPYISRGDAREALAKKLKKSKK